MVEGTSNEEKRYSVLRKLREPYDVYVLANFPITKLPIQLQYEILKRVKEGAGLLLTYRREADERMWRHPLAEAASLVGEVPVAGLTFYRETYLDKMKLGGFEEVPAKLVTGFRIGKGRVALIDYDIQSQVRIAGGFCLTPHEFYTYRTLTEYDYHQSLVAKALLWAAKREPAVRFEGLPAEGIRLSSEARNTPLTLTLSNDGASLRGTLRVSVRNEWGEGEHGVDLKRTVPSGESSVTLDIPQLPGGTHFLDLRFVSARGIEGWASAALLVSAPTVISEVKMAKLSFERDELCAGTVKLSKPCEGRDWSLRVSLLDNYGREFCRRDMPLEEGAEQALFSLPLDSSVSLAGRARVLLMRDGVPLDQVEGEFFVCQRNDDYFPALVWGNLPGIFGHFTGVQLHKTGFNTILHYYGEGTGEGRRPSAIAREDFHAVPYVTRISWDKGRLGDIAADEKATEGLQERARMTMPFDPLVYSLGDENYIGADSGFHENEQPAFVEFIKSRYADVAALTAAWGTDYKSFDEAERIRSNEAAGGKHFVQFHDTEAFREHLYANWHHHCHGVIKEVDPKGRIGAEGSVPGEMEQTIQGLDFWGPYRRTDQNTLLRSLAPRSLVRGNWFGGYNHGRQFVPGLPRFLWESILDGSTLLEVYCSYTCENFYNTDLTWAYWMDAFLPDLREITDGLGQLLVRSEHDCDPVAVYHSQPSVHFERLSKPFGAYEAAQRAALRMLEDLNYVPYYVTSRQVEKGILAEKKPRALVMPHAVALSDKEAAEIERFVREGGVLIADVRPGIARGDCKPRKKGALDHLFGIKREAGEGQPAKVDFELESGFECPALKFYPERPIVGGEIVKVRATGLTVDASVKAADGSVMGKAEEGVACILNHVGKGATALLNVSFDQYSASLDEQGQRPLYSMAAAILFGAEIWQNWTVLDRDSDPIAGGRVSAFARGRAKVLGVLPPRPENVEDPVPATICAAQPAHLYDLRSGRHFGHADKAKVALKFTSATMLSALPYRVTGVDVRAPQRLVAGAPCAVSVRINAKGDTAGARAVIRVNVIGPDGEDRHYYARTLCPEGLEASCSIPFALNDTPGDWKIVARDVLTGTRASKTVRLEESK